ncbi:winged helix-turn-helix transcriptional regulator [Bradyrhizobium sp. CIAT3101]|uniref:winged helix-turn-helix transcriptional regulator n=1 Tax=Bradyrhizobium sp. CIAT3101 TaxID=439387 RepID=UPI0024B095DB|nr:winged helix-turn-helix transcriptional regulator [Bradyrhizobium sp. CIAT3101]WFU80173.1 winged helix-turn-helix transcriptional regulator [Bradyrhizobium sp. CIAT3101]
MQPELRHAPEAKWRRLILYFLAQGGPTRYGELRRAIRDVSDKMLIQQLKEAEADGLARAAVRVSAPSFHQESSPIIPPLSETRANRTNKTLRRERAHLQLGASAFLAALLQKSTFLNQLLSQGCLVSA